MLAADPASTRPRRAEVLAALSLALDLGLGQPMEHMLRAAVIATRMADRIGMDATERGVVYYAELVSWIGCQADSPELSALFADEIAFRAGTFPIDLRGRSRARFLLGQAGHGRPPLAGGRARLRLLADGRRRMHELLESHYASAGALADRLGLGAGVRDAIHHTFERWDGTGLPRGIGGPAIPIAMRIVHVADVIEVQLRAAGPEAAVQLARRRSGTQFDPQVVAVLTGAADEIFAGLDQQDIWPLALSQAPDPRRTLSDPEVDALLIAIGDFVDVNRLDGKDIHDGSGHWRRGPASRAACPRRRCTPCAGPDGCTIWAGWGCRAPSGTAPARCRRPIANGSGSTRTSPSASWGGWAAWPRSQRSPGPIENGWTARGFPAAWMARRCRCRRGCWPPRPDCSR